MSRIPRAAGRVVLALGLVTGALATASGAGRAKADQIVPPPPATASTSSVPAPTTAAPKPPPSIGFVLAPYVGGFDIDNNNFNIATHVVLMFPDLALATTKPGSTTVFLPTDYAFRALVTSLTGKVVVPEVKVFQALQRLGRTTLGAILRTHVLKGTRLTYGQALQSNGKVLTTMSGSRLKVEVRSTPRRMVVLHDGATAFLDPKIINGNVRASNGVIHVIDRVLLPTNPTVPAKA
jgi:uncharacterized surface protein with fasciclin (FAS1) repeats